MATCVSCGASIEWRDGPDGERIPLEEHDQMRGPHRYAEKDGKLVPVHERAEVLARPDHRKTCPLPGGRRR